MGHAPLHKYTFMVLFEKYFLKTTKNISIRLITSNSVTTTLVLSLYYYPLLIIQVILYFIRKNYENSSYEPFLRVSMFIIAIIHFALFIIYMININHILG